MANSDIILSVRDLKKIFPIKAGFFSKQKGNIHAVNGIDFDILKNSSLGLVGESGSGKTTVGKCLIRLIEPTAGKITFDGVNIRKLDLIDLKPVKKKMQMIFQDPYSSLNPRKTVEQIVGEGLKIHKIANGSERADRVAEILKRVGIGPGNMKRYPHQFSGGQRQRIGIARALILNPILIIGDEPVSALDMSIQAQVINLMMELQVEYQLSYLIIAHDLAVVQHMCDEIAVMYLGRIVEFAGKRKFYNSPQHPYSKFLLSAVPIPNPRKKRSHIIIEGDIPSPAELPPGCIFHPRCPQSTKECRQIVPELKEMKKGHFVACHRI